MSKHDMKWYALTSVSAAFLMAAMVSMFNGQPGFILFFFLSVIPLGFRAFAEHSKKRNERKELMQGLANEMGFDFRESATINVLGWSEQFELTKQAKQINDQLADSQFAKWIPSLLPTSQNVLERFIDDIHMAVFDCPTTRNETQIWQTVVALKSPELEIPHFGLYPKEALDKLNAMFQKHVSVHENYRLVTKDTSSFDQLNQQLLDWLQGGWSLEAGEGFLLIYKKGRLATSFEIEELIRVALEIHAVFAEQLQPTA